MAVGRDERLGHLVEELVEDKQNVERELGLRHCREAPQIDEDNCDQPLASLKAPADGPVDGASVGGQQRYDADVGDRANLARQPRAGYRSDAGQRLGLWLCGLWKPL